MSCCRNAGIGETRGLESGRKGERTSTEPIIRLQFAVRVTERGLRPEGLLLGWIRSDDPTETLCPPNRKPFVHLPRPALLRMAALPLRRPQQLPNLQQIAFQTIDEPLRLSVLAAGADTDRVVLDDVADTKAVA